MGVHAGLGGQQLRQQKLKAEIMTMTCEHEQWKWWLGSWWCLTSSSLSVTSSQTAEVLPLCWIATFTCVQLSELPVLYFLWNQGLGRGLQSQTELEQLNLSSKYRIKTIGKKEETMQETVTSLRCVRENNRHPPSPAKIEARGSPKRWFLCIGMSEFILHHTLGQSRAHIRSKLLCA